jgi:transposase
MDNTFEIFGTWEAGTICTVVVLNPAAKKLKILWDKTDSQREDILPHVSDEDWLDDAIKHKHKFAVRLLTVLNRAKGKGTNETAAILGIHPMTVSLYVKRYNAGGIPSLVADKTRNPERAPISEDVKNEIYKTACTEKPADATHWSTRSLAKKFGIGHDAVNRISRERDIKPHLVKKFSFSNDPDFAGKLTDVAACI